MLLTMIRRVESHPRKELLQHDCYFFQTLIVLHIILDQLAARQTLMAFILKIASHH